MMTTMPTGGSIVGKEAKRIAASMVVKDGVETSEALLPRFDADGFDADGNVYGYQRLLDPDKVNMLNVDEHIGRNLGAWAGSVIL